jgi:hypothetical protein
MLNTLNFSKPENFSELLSEKIGPIVPLSLPIAKGKTNFKMFINCL